MLNHTVESPFFTGPLRSPARLQNTFAHECMMDEVAAALKADPVAYRLRHVADPRLKAVITAAAKTAAWETRPSPRRGRTPNRRGHRPRHRLRAVRRRQRLLRERHRRRGQPGHRRHRRQALRRRDGLRADLQSRRHQEPGRGGHAAGRQPRAARGSDLERRARHVGGLAHAIARCTSAPRCRASRPC